MKSGFFKIVILLLLATGYHTAWANVQIENTLAECKKLMAEGKTALEEGRFAESLEFYTKAEVIAEKEGWNNQLFIIKNDIGTVYNCLSNYGEALGYYRKALKIAEDARMQVEIPMVLNNIGLLYHREKDYKTALEYYKRAYKDPSIKKSGYTRALLGINISDLYNKLGNYKEGRKYLLEVEDVTKSRKFEQGWQVNFAEGLLIEGQVTRAQKMMEQLVKNADTGKASGCYVCVVELLSKIYARQGKTSQAILYAQKGLQNTPEMKDRIEFYDQLSQLYYKNHEYEIAFRYRDSVVAAKDSITVLMNRGLYESNKVKLKVQEYQNDAKLSNERHAAESKLMYSILVAFAAIVITIVLMLRQKKILAERSQKITVLELEKEKNDKLLLEKQIREKETNAILEQERLKNEIESRNRKLSANALYLSGRNELIQEVINSLSNIPEVSRNKEVSTYMKTLMGYLKTDEEWDDFVAHFEQVNPGLLKILKTLHPELTAKDIRYLCYVYMNLDSKELSIVFNITPDACRRRERRLLQKMNLDMDMSLYEYLLQL
jgi:tetratricopeptide (TPR) repeat protein